MQKSFICAEYVYFQVVWYYYIERSCSKERPNYAHEDQFNSQTNIFIYGRKGYSY